MMRASPTIKWTVPWEWHKQRTRAELQGVFTLGVFTRIILVSVGLAVGICYGAERALGPLEFNWTRAIAISVLSGIGVLLVGGTASFVPPAVQVSAKGIAVLKGQGSFVVSFRDASCISIQESAIPVLTFRKKTREYHYAIAQTVDLTQLRQVLERFSGSPVKIDKLGQPDGAANQSQPVGLGTKRESAAAASRRSP
jgi:hypothetical protein